MQAAPYGTDPSSGPSPSTVRQRTALFVACVTVGLERFAFYVVVALLLLFLTERHHQSDAQASTWYGILMGATYFTPLFGGMISDRIGRWLSVNIGAFLLFVAYGLLSAGLLSAAIVLLSVGMGLLKANLTAAVGSIYPTAIERDIAFTRFYSAANIGSLPAGFASGWLAKRYGYPTAFLSASCACLLAWALWSLTERSLFTATHHTQNEESHAPERDRLITLYVLLPVAVLFFLSFQQSGASLTLFAKEHTVLSLFGITIEAPWFQSVSSALVIGLTPLLGHLWKRWPLATHRKFLMGMLLSSASCLVMSAASVYGGNTGRVSPWWLLSSYFLFSIGELCVSPIGFSLVTKLSPKRLLGVLMGAWFAAISLGNLGAGLMGRFWKVWPHHLFFGALAATSGIAVLLILGQQRRLGRVLGGST